MRSRKQIKQLFENWRQSLTENSGFDVDYELFIERGHLLYSDFLIEFGNEFAGKTVLVQDERAAIFTKEQELIDIKSGEEVFFDDKPISAKSFELKNRELLSKLDINWQQYKSISIKKGLSISFKEGTLTDRNEIYGPALIKIDINGLTYEFYSKGKTHRENGPAVISPFMEMWYFRGKPHRVDGPAYTDQDQEKYALNGVWISEEEFQQRTNER